MNILKILCLNLTAITFLLPSFSGTGGELYAQDPELFEHTWYFIGGEIDGEELLLPEPNFEAKLNFEIENGFLISHPFCKEQLIGEIEFHLTENEFNLLQGTFILLGVCGPPIYNFIQTHYSLYYVDEEFPKNTFSYTLDIVNDYLQLIITNGEGDWAVYNSVMLSTHSFNQNRFTLYPNPVKEVLQVNNSSNQPVTAIIYDINGKKIQAQSLKNNLSTINVKALKQGLYFAVFESETGERVSKKFVKK